MSKEPTQVLWSTEDKDNAIPTHGWKDHFANGWQYRIVFYESDCWYAKARKVWQATLERRRWSSDDWRQVGPRVDVLKGLFRLGTCSGKPHMYHSRKTAIAFLQGVAAAQRD
ncbi:MAG TPA: hypothetical protein V6D22_07690 [Candidatus Obscuribacterales bacterium]